MSSSSPFCPDFRETPYWWDGVFSAPGSADAPAVPSHVDVLVVGAGLTGVSAAYELAKAGRKVLVCDANEPGSGASSRNFGMVGRYSRHPFSSLMKNHGLDVAKSYYNKLDEVYLSTILRIEEEELDCDLRKTGRFIGALRPEHFERLKKEYELRAEHLDEDVRIIPADQQVEIGTGVYHGGVYIASNASIHPGRYYKAMRERAERQGAQIAGHTPVVAIAAEKDGFAVKAGNSVLRARDVLVATNGYSGKVTPWITRRLTPIVAYMIATEPLPPETIAEILPNRRSYSDNRRTTNSMTVSPDGRRLLMNGRTGEGASSMKARALDIYSDLLYFFPKLAGVRISHGWVCRCAATWNQYPATGVYRGMHYALGYCFSGNAMAPHLGRKAAMRILGRPEAETIWTANPLPPRVPAIARNPVAVSSVMKYYRWADRPAAR